MYTSLSWCWVTFLSPPPPFKASIHSASPTNKTFSGLSSTVYMVSNLTIWKRIKAYFSWRIASVFSCKYISVNTVFFDKGNGSEDALLEKDKTKGGTLQVVFIKYCMSARLM